LIFIYINIPKSSALFMMLRFLLYYTASSQHWLVL